MKRHGSNRLRKEIYSTTAKKPKKILINHIGGTWCGYIPDLDAHNFKFIEFDVQF